LGDGRFSAEAIQSSAPEDHPWTIVSLFFCQGDSHNLQGLAFNYLRNCGRRDNLSASNALEQQPPLGVVGLTPPSQKKENLSDTYQFRLVFGKFGVHLEAPQIEQIKQP